MMHLDLSGDNMTKNKRPRYAPEFRLEAAQLVVDQNYSIRETAQAHSHIVRYITGYYSQLKPHVFNKRLTPNETKARHLRAS